MKWNIITDSSCDLMPYAVDAQLQMTSVPFIISAGGRDFVDDETLDPAVMLEAMERSPEASHTSCPPPQSWVEQFEKAEQCIAITISSRLSGSMNSARIAKALVLESEPHKRIALLDSCSAGPELVLCAEKIRSMIQSGMEFDTVVSEAELLLKRSHVIFALSSFDNLVKNGRMSKAAGFIAKKLGMWGIGVGSDKGEIVIKGKTRGEKGVLAMIIKDMKERHFQGGEVAISHCQNPALAEKLKQKIRETWENSDVRILPTRGLCSFYAERNGLILSY